MKIGKGRPDIVNGFLSLDVHCIWRKKAIPQEFEDAFIIHLYKRKGNPQVCDNHRGIVPVPCLR